MINKFRFTASVEESHLDKIQEVARRLESNGCKVDQVMDLIGIITGSTDSLSKIDALQIKGIKHIESEGTFQISPSDSPIH